MISGLIWHYRDSKVTPPKVLHVDRDCCLARLKPHFKDWGTWWRASTFGISQSHALYPAFMSRLSACVFEWDAEDLQGYMQPKHLSFVLVVFGARKKKSPCFTMSPGFIMFLIVRSWRDHVHFIQICLSFKVEQQARRSGGGPYPGPSRTCTHGISRTTRTSPETFAKRTGVLSTTAAQFPAFPQPTKSEGCPEPKSCASSYGGSPTGTCTFVQQPHSYTRATDHIVPPPGKSAWKSTTKSKRKKKISTNDYA